MKHTVPGDTLCWPLAASAGTLRGGRTLAALLGRGGCEVDINQVFLLSCGEGLHAWQGSCNFSEQGLQSSRGCCEQWCQAVCQGLPHKSTSLKGQQPPAQNDRQANPASTVVTVTSVRWQCHNLVGSCISGLQADFVSVPVTL